MPFFMRSLLICFLLSGLTACHRTEHTKTPGAALSEKWACAWQTADTIASPQDAYETKLLIIAEASCYNITLPLSPWTNTQASAWFTAACTLIQSYRLAIRDSPGAQKALLHSAQNTHAEQLTEWDYPRLARYLYQADIALLWATTHDVQHLERWFAHSEPARYAPACQALAEWLRARQKADSATPCSDLTRDSLLELILQHRHALSPRQNLLLCVTLTPVLRKTGWEAALQHELAFYAQRVRHLDAETLIHLSQIASQLDQTARARTFIAHAEQRVPAAPHHEPFPWAELAQAKITACYPHTEILSTFHDGLAHAETYTGYWKPLTHARIYCVWAAYETACTAQIQNQKSQQRAISACAIFSR